MWPTIEHFLQVLIIDGMRALHQAEILLTLMPNRIYQFINGLDSFTIIWYGGLLLLVGNFLWRIIQLMGLAFGWKGLFSLSCYGSGTITSDDDHASSMADDYQDYDIDSSPVINPATGLPMVGDSIGGFDVGGNVYGSSSSLDDGFGYSSTPSAFDDSVSSSSSSSFDDSFSSSSSSSFDDF